MKRTRIGKALASTLGLSTTEVMVDSCAEQLSNRSNIRRKNSDKMRGWHQRQLHRHQERIVNRNWMKCPKVTGKLLESSDTSRRAEGRYRLTYHLAESRPLRQARARNLGKADWSWSTGFQVEDATRASSERSCDDREEVARVANTH